MDRWSQDAANKKARHPPARVSSVARDTSRRRTSSQQRNDTGLYVPDQEPGPPRRASRSLRSLPALEQEETTGVFPATGTRRAVRPAKAESSRFETWATTVPAGDLLIDEWCGGHCGGKCPFCAQFDKQRSFYQGRVAG
jgi:hypothetical protein